jgi:hypothetical protein
LRIIELLSSQLDREAQPQEISAMEHLFSERIDFWNLCFEARRILLEEKEAEEEKEPSNDTHKE